MRAALLCCVLAGCFDPSPQAGAPCSASGACPAGLVCTANNRCEKAGAAVDACPETTCNGNDLIACGMTTTCANGCDGTTPHCLQLAPSNGLTVALLDGATADVTTLDLDFDTTTGAITIKPNTVIRPAGEGVFDGIRFAIVDGVAVWAAHSWTATGTGGDAWKADGKNAMALFAATTLSVSGRIDVGGSGNNGGPGASAGNGSTTSGGCRGRAGRANAGVGAAFGEGGGGGGAIHAGADGAASNQPGATGAGGTTCSEPSTIPLRGGNGGGHGGESAVNGGGGGGGGLMLVAMESITISGTVGAPGGGGLSSSTGNGGGGGGGSGGAILVEAPVVTIDGAVTANGGGGGAPAGGSNGSRGSLTSSAAAAGGTFSCVPSPGATPVTRRGGAGGTGTLMPTSGTTCTAQDGVGVTVSSQGGGGGGAAGRIEIKRASGSVTGVISPAPAMTEPTFE